MKIINDTAWRSDQIRTIVKRVAEEELDPEQRKRAIIRIEYRGRNRCLGRGQIGHSPLRAATTIWLYVDRPEHLRRIGKGWCAREGCGRPYQVHRFGSDHPFEAFPVEPRLSGSQLASVAAHEFQHNLGRRHRHMHRKYLGHDYTPWSWATDVEPAPQFARPSAVEAADAKLAHASAMLRKAETRAKRATTILRKWQRRVRDSARRAATLRQTGIDTDSTSPAEHHDRPTTTLHEE